MTDHETSFHDFLRKILKTNSEIAFNGLLTALSEYPDKADGPDYLLRVMKSGIFYKGGLKGKILLQTQSGQVIDRKVWPISSLKELLVQLAAVMVAATDPVNPLAKEYVSGYFDYLLKAFDRAAPFARLGGVWEPTLKKTRQALLNWKEKTIRNIPISPINAHHAIAEILIAHLPPKTPDLTIAERINELMAAFNQEGGKIGTLRKMVADKKKK